MMIDEHQQSRKRIIGATAIVVAAIALSKISGLVRDQIMAAYFGISLATDAFTWANFIPNLFRILLAESIIVAAFIPVYTTLLSAAKKKQAQDFVSSLTNIMLCLFFFLSAAVFILAPQIGQLLSIFSQNNFDIVTFVTLSRIMAFSLIFLSMSGLTAGMLNTHNLFTVPSISPLVVNLSAVVFVVILSGRIGIASMAIGTMVGSAAQLLIQLPQLKVSGLRYRFLIDLKNPALKEVFGLMFPILLSLGAVQINNSVDNFFALNLGIGNTTALTLSWRVANLPLGIFSVAVITVLYPLISRQAAAEDISGLKESFSLGFREIGYIMVPASVGLVMLANPIIRILFERNEFIAADTQKVAYILIFHSIGLLFFGLLMIMNRIFYAFKNVKVPLIVAAASIFTNFFLDWLLSRFLDVGGLALSTSLVAAINVAILLAILRKKIGHLGAKRITKSYLKIFLSTAIMALSIYFGWRSIEVIAQRSNAVYLLCLLGVIAAGTGIYLFCTFLFKMDEIKFLVYSMKRRTRR